MEHENSRQGSWHCRIDSAGRVVLPKELRDDKHLQSGDELVVSIEDGSIVMRTYEEAMQRLQNMFCDGLDPKTSLVDELLENRNQEAEIEARR